MKAKEPIFIGSALVTSPRSGFPTNCELNRCLSDYYPFIGNVNDASENGKNGTLNEEFGYVYGRNGVFKWNVSGVKRFFRGFIDDVRVYSRTRSLNEIRSLYQFGNVNSDSYGLQEYWKGTSPNGSTFATAFVAWYPFNANVNDARGNGNNGMLNGEMGYVYGMNGRGCLDCYGVANGFLKLKTDWTTTKGKYVFLKVFDDVRIYNRALSSNEVRSFYQIGDVDSDSDGLPDWWETQWFGDTTTANAATDYDGNSATELQEYWNGTSPNDATLANGFVAWYPLNGNANDASGNGNNGMVNEELGYVCRMTATFDEAHDNVLGTFSL